MRSARWAGLFLAAASAAGAAWAQAENTIYFRPGDQGVIVYTLSNDQPTYGTAEGVRISAALPDGYSLDAESVLGPIPIAPGAQGTLRAVVDVDPQAPEGVHGGVIIATATTQLLPALPEVPVRLVLDSVPPQIKVFDPNGSELAEGSPVEFSSVTVTALDDVSGVSTITIEGFDSATYPQETHEAARRIEGLSNRTYLITATDWSGNVSTRTFSVSLPQPRMALLWGAHAGFVIADSTPPGGGFPFVNPTLGTGIQVEFEPRVSGAGAASMQVFAYDANGQPQEIGSNDGAFSGSHVYTASDEGLDVLSQLPVGQVTFFGRDSLGLETSVTVNVTTTALIVMANGQVLASGQFTGSRRLELFAIPGSTEVALSGTGGEFRADVTATVGFVQGEFDQVPEGSYAAAALDEAAVLIASQAVNVDLAPPSVVMTVPGTSEVIADQGFTNSRSVNIEADDNGAGVKKITVTGFDPVVFSTQPPIIGITVSSAVAILEDLDDGVYLVQAEDGVGNVRMTTFTVETGPSLSVFGAGPVPLYDDWRSTAPPAVIPSDVLWGNFTSFPDGASPEQLMFPDAISFHAGDPAGLASVAVAGAGFSVTAVYINGQLSNASVDPGNLPPGTTEVAGSFDVSAAGRYAVSVTRPDGVQSIAPFDIVTMSASNEKDQTYALYDVDAKSFLSGKLALQLSASAGIATVSADHNDNGASIPVSNDHGYSVAVGEAEFANPLGVRVFFDDTRGNSWSYLANFLDGTAIAPASYALDPFDPSLSDAVLISSYPGLPPFPWRAGVYNTSTFDIYDSSALPGGALIQEPSPTGGSLAPILAGGITSFAEHASASLALSTITVGHIHVTLHTTGGAIAGADGATVYDGFVYFSTFPAESEFPPTGGGVVSADPGLPEALQLARTWSLTITIKDLALDRIPINLCAAPDTTTMQCHDGTILAVTASRGGGPRVKAMPFKGFESGFVKTLVPAGLSGGSLDLGTGIRVSNLNTHAAGVFVSGVSYRPPDPGYRALPLNQAFNVTPSAGFLSTPFTVTLDFDGSGLSEAQRQQLRLVRILNGLMSDDLPFAPNGDNEVSFQTATGGYFMLLTTVFPDPVKFVDGGVSIVYSQAALGGAAITSQSADPFREPLKSLLAQALAVGQAPVGPLTELLPEDTPLNPQGILRVGFDQTQRAQQGMSDSPIRLLELSNGVPKPAILPNAYFAYETPGMSARIAGIHSFYGVFGSTTPRYIDSLPPVTSLSFGPPVTYDASGGVTLTTASPIALSAVDLQDGNIPPSGVATTYFLVDQAFQDFQTTPPQVYGSTFSLPAGAHTLRYFSSDHAGNLEAPKSESVTVSGPSQGGTGGSSGSGGPQKGLAIAADSSGKLWEVGSDSGTLWLGRYGPEGLEARVQLPGAVEDGAWSLRFDPSGNVYSIGTAGATTEAVEVYAVSSAGVLLSSAGFQAAGGAQAIAWDASGELWITGALQQGPSEDGSLSLTMGLWKFTPASGLLALTTTYTRGGPADSGFGVRTLDGNVYVSGYSSTQPLSTPALALALWKFDAQGHGPLAGPFLEPGYLRSLSAPPIARLETTSGTLYAAAMRSNAAGLTDLGFVRYDASGEILSDHFVTVDGYSLAPRGIALDGQGNIAVGLDAEGPQGPVHGVARFAKDGGLAAFQADSASTAAVSGLAALGADLWLALDGSTAPVRFIGDLSVPALDVLVSSQSDLAPPAFQVSPATGPVGIPFTVSGSGFGTYAGSNTRVTFGGVAAPISLWNDTTIQGTVPGLSSGTYAVAVERLSGSSSAGTFQVLLPQATSLSLSSAPIGQPFTITGTAFGNYSSSLTKLLVGGVPAPVSIWNDTTIAGTLPGVSTGTQNVLVERATSGGFVADSTAGVVEVTLPAIAALSKSSAPIGSAITLTGSSFGSYAGGLTVALLGGTTCPVSLWNDTTITLTVPGAEAPGIYPLVVARLTSDGGRSESAPVSFVVVAASATGLSATSGPIGLPITVTGSGFGAYLSGNSRLRIGDKVAPVSLWNDSTITGTVPGLPSGAYPVLIEIQQGADVAVSTAGAFTVTDPAIASLAPSSGPIGATFYLSGASFGPYATNLTTVLLGDATAPISLWNDAAITGTVPGSLLPGTYPLIVQRQTSDSFVSQSSTMTFTVAAPFAASLAPSTGPIGIPFTLTGSGFGAYLGSNTRVRIGGLLAPISLWNDTTIKGIIPGLSSGTYVVCVEIQQGSGVAVSTITTFGVTLPQVDSLTPASAPIGNTFTAHGASFGPYAGALTMALIGGATSPISLWNDTTITGTIPGALAPGTYPFIVQRMTSDGVLAQSSSVPFTVTGAGVASMTPSTGPVGIPFTITGSGFGAYLGANTRVRIGDALAPISLWNDAAIQGTIPGVSSGAYSVLIEVQQGSYVSVTTAASFGVILPELDSLSVTSGPIGAPLTLTGAGFGLYAGSLTKLLIGGVAAPVSLWTDTQIKAAAPGSAPAGDQPLVVERSVTGGFIADSSSLTFTVTTPSVASVTPSSAPIGAPFTIVGASFGPYAGANTQVLFGGIAAPISLWNDTTIKGSVPGAVAPGIAALVVLRSANGVNADASAGDFSVLQPVVSTITPPSGDAGTAFELDGHGFGPYAGSQTKVLVGGAAATISLWNDQLIRGIIPDSLSVGTYTVVVQRSPSGGVVESDPVIFTVGTPIGGASLKTSLAVAQPSWYYQAALTLPADEGGTVQAPSRAAVEIPPGAVAQDLPVTIDRAPADDHAAAVRGSALSVSELGKAGDAVQYGPEGTQFSAPVTISVPFDPNSVLSGALATLAVHYWSPQAGEWQALPSQVDAVHHLVTARTSHFSVYQVLAPVGSLTPQAAASSSVDTVQVACNPLRPGCRPMAFQNLPAGARIRLYTLSGNLVKDFSADGAGTATWDGTNKDGQPVASGVYLLYAQGAGGKKLLKVAVQR